MSTVPRYTVVIPARMGSARLKNKLAQNLVGDDTVLQHLYRRAILEFGAESVVVATDSMVLADSVQQVYEEANVWVNGDNFRNGTERVAACTKALDIQGPVVNIQADEPTLNFEVVRTLLDNMDNASKESVYTPFTWLPSEDAAEQGLVTTVANGDSEALYFSRATLPMDKTGTGGGLDHTT